METTDERSGIDPGVGEDLRRLADMAQQIARVDMEERGGLTVPIIFLRHADGEIKRLPFPKDCGRLMNSGAAKDAIFGFIRAMVKDLEATGVVIVTEAWFAKATEKGWALGAEELKRRTRERAFETALKDGLIERWEALMITVQTPKAALLRRQKFTRDQVRKRIVWEATEDTELKVGEFGGRQKMYGDLSQGNLS